jgi:hypothetical protein
VEGIPRLGRRGSAAVDVPKDMSRSEDLESMNVNQDARAD